ncbi:hypothetical protein VPH35_033811 [Triticum aestivum]
MALWTGLGQAATVAQLVGADVGGLISMIVQAALTARQNRSECEQLARRLLMIAQLLPRARDTLRDAHELVVSCQGRSAAYQFVMAGRRAERFREVQSKIDSYLIVFPVISHSGITRRLERIYNVLVPNDSTSIEPSPLPHRQGSTEVAQEVLLHETQEFTLVEIMAATNNFALDNKIGCGGFGTVYKGSLQDGREVAIKHTISNYRGAVEDFNTEVAILSRLRHKHIIRLLGSWRKEPEVPERLIVYEYMENGTLFDHLHPYKAGSSSLSPVTMSWKACKPRRPIGSSRSSSLIAPEGPGRQKDFRTSAVLDNALDEPEPTEVAQEVPPHGTQEFTLAEIMAATNNFALDTKIHCGSSGTVYRGRLHDGREVAIKHFNYHEYSVKDFSTELDNLSRLRHKHIICLLGSWRKEPEERERLIVYEYMENGTLFDHLHSDHGSSTLSPVTMSWKMCMDVLLGVSRAIEHMHCHAIPPIIHRDIKSANIVFDASWVPRVGDFGLSVAWNMTRDEEGMECIAAGTLGYLDPECHVTFLLKLASDVYSLGMLMLEILTGKKVVYYGEKGITSLTIFALPA